MAMKEESDAIGQHQVFGHFMELPEGRKALPSHWVYRIKQDGAGNVQWFKARLACGGNHQIEGIDYQAMYAPITRLGNVRQALAIAAKYDPEIHHMDLCTAFLGVDLEEDSSMHPTQGYFRLLQNGSRFNNTKLTKTLPKMPLRLRNSLYGLQQSWHVWYSTFKDRVILIGFLASCVDKRLFMLYYQDQEIVAAVDQCVDDVLIIANEGLIGQIKDQMKKKFQMYDLGSVFFYLGINFESNCNHHQIDISQRNYIQTILANLRMDKRRPVATAMAMKIHKRKPDEEDCDPTIYQSMIGNLLCAMTSTRPDIAYATRLLNRCNHDPSNGHMVALKHLFRYLNGTKD